MSKRQREDETVPPGGQHPIVATILKEYEQKLATFMDSLSPLLERYNDLLQKALPHNPKAPYYYSVASKNSNDADSPDAKVSTTSAAAQTAASDSKKEKSPRAASTPAEPKSPQKRPTSPLLRRPQLEPAQLEELNLEARAELQKRTGEFPSPSAFSTANAHRDASPVPSSDAAASHQPIRAQLNRVLNDKSNKTQQGQQNTTTTTTAEPGTPAESTTTAATTGTKPTTTKAANGAELAAKTVAQLLEEVKPSPILLAQLRVIKREAGELITTLDQIHDWIAMRAPAMSENNDCFVTMLGVASDIMNVTTVLQTLYEMEWGYISKRSSLELEYVSHYEIGTVRQMIDELDASKWDDLEAGWRTIMRLVILIHTKLAQNMKTLKSPVEKGMVLSI